MTNPAKVLGFLDVVGSWDPSLAFVMGSALAVSAIAYRLQKTPLQFSTSIDARLIAGASLFGLGWGLAGFCPGPAIASLVTGSSQVVTFVASMLGAWLYTTSRSRGRHNGSRPSNMPRELILVGGGHAHVEVIRRYALEPLPDTQLTVVDPNPFPIYSGMVPGFVAEAIRAERARD